MERRQRLLIYDRREMAVLIALSVLVASFAFTLGIHLGKKVANGGDVTPAPVSAIETQPDELPTRQSLAEQVPAADRAAEEVLDRSLHEEVQKTGVRLETPRVTELPRQTKREKADTLSVIPDSRESETVPANRRVSPSGKFTLQVGSHPAIQDALAQVELLEGEGLKPFIRGVDLKAKGRWYRVYVGGYADREEAHREGLRYTAEQMIESFLVANMTD